MRYRKSRGPAESASDQELFERALRGERAHHGGEDRKALQLCRQVQRALMLADVAVESVEPMGAGGAGGAGGGQLLVRVVLDGEESAMEAMARLHERGPALRAAVARAICRKRVPGLSFVMVPRGGGGQ